MKLKEIFEAKERSVLSVMGRQPEHFDGNFSCYHRDFTSLEGCPSSVGGHFHCGNNNLISLEGAPSSIGDNFYCDENKLTSLEGAPSTIGGEISCYENNLTSLHNIHKQIKHIGGFANFEHNPITSCVLGLLLIDGLKLVYLDNKEVQAIINKHLQGEKDIFACQEELIQNGFEEFAKL